MSKIKNDSLGDRMKNYENVTRNYLTCRTPVIIRCDGAHFHTLTKGFTKPYDSVFNNAMMRTMRYLCENVQNCVLGYTQSDEITLVLCDYKTLTTSAWFGNNIQKMSSTAAALASVAFNLFLSEEAIEAFEEEMIDGTKLQVYLSKHFATFDARVFNLPKEEVCNCLIWRQQDAIRNSIQGLGQAYFSQKQLQDKSCTIIKEMLLEKGMSWEYDTPLKFQRGVCCIKGEYGWNIDENIPLFTENRKYVDDRIVFEEA